MMWAMSTALADTLRTSHRVAVSMPAVAGGAEVGVDLAPYLLGGSVTVQRAGVQRRLDCELGNFDGQLTIDDALSLLSPLSSTDLAPTRGARLPDGMDELVPLGVFRVASAEPSNSGTVRVSGYDYGWVISRARLESPYQIPAGTNYTTAISDLLRDRYPPLVPDLPPTDKTTPTLTFDEQADPWERAVAMAEAIGYILEFAQDGRVRMRQQTTSVGEAQPVWSFAADDTRGTLVDLNRTFNAEGVFNVVVVTGETAGDTTPIRGTAEDSNPTSPTYAAGRYGRVPYFYSSPLLTTANMAREAAVTILARELGWSTGVKISAIPNPALELGDVVRVQEPDTALDGLFLVEALSIPLRANQMMTVDTTASVEVNAA